MIGVMVVMKGMVKIKVSVVLDLSVRMNVRASI